MLLKLAAVALAVPVAGAATVAATGVVLVDVREHKANGQHLVIPVPMLPLRVLAGLVPHGAIPLQNHHHRMDEDARQAMRAGSQVLQALAASPDGELVRAEERDQTVVVAKEDGHITVHVRSPREQVDVNVPLELAQSVLEDAQDGMIDPSAILGALARTGRGKLVEVHADDADVSIRVM
jgi:hypothetical protein